MVLAEAQTHEIVYPAMGTIVEMLRSSARVAALGRLLELGAIETNYLEPTTDVLSNMDKIPGTNFDEVQGHAVRQSRV